MTGTQHTVAWLAAVVLILGVVVAATNGDRSAPLVPSRPITASAPAPASTAATASSTPSTAASAQPGGQAVATHASPTSSISVTKSAPMPALPDARPARPGRYTYSATVDGVAGPASLVVRDVRAGRFTERLSVGGSVNQRTVRWQAGQTSLLDTYSRSGSCAYDPAPTDLLLPLRSGASWRTRGTCHPTDGSIDMAEQARITGAATVRLEGKDTPVWVIERSTTMTARSAGTTVVSETRRTDLFAPGLGLIVYQAGRSAAPDENGKVRTSTWTLELASASAR